MGSDAPWHERYARTARAHGALAYEVEGFVEVTEAVRRGHAVIVRRERVEVADGVTVFPTPSPPPRPEGSSAADSVAAILRFDIGSACYMLHDATGSEAQAPVALTPRRLQRYLDAPARRVGVAIGG